MLLKSN